MYIDFGSLYKTFSTSKSNKNSIVYNFLLAFQWNLVHVVSFSWHHRWFCLFSRFSTITLFLLLFLLPNMKLFQKGFKGRNFIQGFLADFILVVLAAAIGTSRTALGTIGTSIGTLPGTSSGTSPGTQI